MKKVLITGANGFIGKYLVGYFQENGYDTVGWVRTLPKQKETWLRQVNMEIPELVERQLGQDLPDIIIHCAGCANVGESVRFPQKDFVGNVVLTHNLLFSLQKLKLNHVRIIYLSSAAVYGNPKELPIHEKMELSPLSPYAMHKIMGEEICNFFSDYYQMDIKIARIFSAYGRGLKKQIFWDMYQRYQETQKLVMYGTGKESRDFIHIADLARAILLIATSKSDYSVYNVANGKDISISQATEYFAECAEISKDRISFNGIVREGDPLNWCADISRLKEIGYCQSVFLKEGLTDYLDWLKEVSAGEDKE